MGDTVLWEGKGQGKTCLGRGHALCRRTLATLHPAHCDLRSSRASSSARPPTSPGADQASLRAPSSRLIAETSSLHPQKGRTLGEFIAIFLRGGTGLASLASPQAHLQVPAAGAGAEVWAGTGAGAEATDNDIPDTDTDPVVAVPSGPTRTGGLRSGLQRRGACGTHAECRTTINGHSAARHPRGPRDYRHSTSDYKHNFFSGPDRASRGSLQPSGRFWEPTARRITTTVGTSTLPHPHTPQT